MNATALIADELQWVRPEPSKAELADICKAADAMLAYEGRIRLKHKARDTFRRGGSYKGPTADEILSKYITAEKGHASLRRYAALNHCATILARRRAELTHTPAGRIMMDGK